MKVMIFAAGMGTRLKPLTDSMPKALVPIAGKSLLQHVIEKLKGAGFRSFVVNIHHFAEQIREFVRDNESFGAEISFSDETDMLRETGGGIRHAAPLLNDGEPFLVHNVDILSNLNVEEFYKGHCKDYKNGNIFATLLVSDRVTERYLLFNEDNILVGWMNIKTGEVKSPYAGLRRSPVLTCGDMNVPIDPDYFDYEAFLEKNKLKKYAFAGIHIISPELLPLMDDMPEKFPIIDFYLSICDRYNIKGHVAEGLRLVDVGKLNSLQVAEELVRELDSL